MGGGASFVAGAAVLVARLLVLSQRGVVWLKRVFFDTLSFYFCPSTITLLGLDFAAAWLRRPTRKPRFGVR